MFSWIRKGEKGFFDGNILMDQTNTFFVLFLFPLKRKNNRIFMEYVSEIRLIRLI
jgi:hypothetical protein